MEIPEGRLKIFPETNLCSASCIEDTKLTASAVISENISKEAEKEKKKRVEKIKKLSEKKHTCIDAYNKYQSGKITKEDYKREFKRFTWWIKEQIEEIGGRLIYNPSDYTECEKCRKPAIVFWTKKEIYFISCSNYKNGCKWKVWPWTFETKE